MSGSSDGTITYELMQEPVPSNNPWMAERCPVIDIRSPPEQLRTYKRRLCTCGCQGQINVDSGKP